MKIAGLILLATVLMASGAAAQGTHDYTGPLPHTNTGPLPPNTTAPTPNRQRNAFSPGAPTARARPAYRRWRRY